MGSVRRSLAGVAVLVLVASARPVVAVEAVATVHGIEAAAVYTVEAAAEVNAPWQPLHSGIDDVTEGNNPITKFGAVATTTSDTVTRFAESLPAESPINTLQTGSNSLYLAHDQVTFAVIQTPRPASVVEGELAGFSLHWRLAGAPVQPANPTANGDATVDASHTFSLIHDSGQSEFAYAQSDGSRLVDRNGNSIAAWEFVAGGVYHLLVAIPGVPDAVWASAVNAETTEAADFAIQILPAVTGLGDEGTLTLRVQTELTEPGLIDQWTAIVSERISVADLAGPTAEAVDAAERTEGSTGLPTSPPLEVDESGNPVLTTELESAESVWRWIAGGIIGTGVLALLIRALGSMLRRPSGSTVVRLPPAGSSHGGGGPEETGQPRSLDAS